MKVKSDSWGGVVCAAGFTALGLLFIGRAGLQTDEALFAAPLFRRPAGIFWFDLGRHQVPVMFLTYLGALKNWLFAAILKLQYPTHLLIRIPAVLIGAATILLSWELLRRLHSVRAAWVGSVLIATDTMFLLTTTFDWGPVALQHLLTVAIMLLAFCWYRTGGMGTLTAAAFCSGLALWDKALFVWIFGGLLVALLIFLPGIRRRLSWRQVLIGVAAFLLGAAPLIAYNFSSEPRFSTFHSNSRITFNEFPGKLTVLRKTFDGSALFGYLVNEPGADELSPQTGIETISAKIRSVAGLHRSNALELAFLASLVLLVLWLLRDPVRKPILFFLIVLCVAWFQMGITFGAGGAAHHTVLLWPLPHFIIALAFSAAALRLPAAAGRWALVAITAFLAITNLLVTNQYLHQFVRDGAAGSWTDAIFELSKGLQESHAKLVILPDWGMTDSLTVLSRGKLEVRPVDHPFLPLNEDPAQRERDLAVLSDKNAVWVEHTAGNEQFQGVNAALQEAVQREGFLQIPEAVYRDRNGRSIFQTFRFVKRPASVQ